MKKKSGIMSLVVAILVVMVCLSGVSYAVGNSAATQTEAKIILHQHHDNDGCAASTMESNRGSIVTAGMPVLFTQNIPEPNCVCAGCGKKCGTGHTSSCPYRPKSR
jgi:hypothetical protein